MTEVSRGSGLTASEKYLGKLADHSFLDLWSYPNIFIDKMSNNGRGGGKELCDLLVVCGDHVLIFSDKTIAWPTCDSPELAWTRWYRRAVKNSVKQVRGAERWISLYPDRLFLDQNCTQRLPLDLPPPERRKVHGIVVALGAGDACRTFFGGGSGSLTIRPSVAGDAHMDPAAPQFSPFSIGDVDPGGPFVHVFDDVTLDIMLRELDTISDFTMYLERKALFVRSGHLLSAHGEEELLGYYATRLNGQGDHDFVSPSGAPFSENERISIGEGFFSDMLVNPQYLAKKAADEVSYVWDALIRAFTQHLLAGTLANVEGFEQPTLSDTEKGVRYMALETRLGRRVHGEAIVGAIRNAHPEKRFVRAMVPKEGDPDNETGFAFLMVPCTDFFDANGGYESYRLFRAHLLRAYVMNFHRRYPYLKRMIGIATEPPSQITGRPGSSEDMVYFEPDGWTPAMIEEAETLRNGLGILQDSAKEYSVHADEYVRTDRAQGTDQGSRQQRRAAERQAKKASRQQNR